MRIISGKLRGRRLASPSDRRVRPTSDKVKEAIFSMILEYIDQDSVCVDLFSGTGNLGLEAISRGAKRVYFGDRSKDSVALTRQNVKHCQAEDQAVILFGDYARVLDRISEKADVIFLDPPYMEGILTDALQAIMSRELLGPGGVIVAEHGSRECLPDLLFGLAKKKEKKYGGISVTLYEAAADDTNN